MGEVFRILKEGGALGGLALALVAIGYLFVKLHSSWEAKANDAMAETKRLTVALEEEKDEHRQTAMSIVGLSQDLARLLEKLSEKRSHARRGTTPGNSVRTAGDLGSGSRETREEDDSSDSSDDSTNDKDA